MVGLLKHARKAPPKALACEVSRIRVSLMRKMTVTARNALCSVNGSDPGGASDGRRIGSGLVTRVN
jgi:hypothetical protein